MIFNNLAAGLLKKFGSASAMYGTLGLESKSKQTMSEIFRLKHLESSQAKHIPKAVIISGDDYKKFKHISRFVSVPGLENEADAKEFMEEHPYSENVQTVGFINSSVISEMCSALSKEEVIALIENGPSCPIEGVLLPRVRAVFW